MKCPNCGMDIVIATHLCPHCGYAHDFDGSMEPRREIPEPGEITPEKSRKRREKRERAASTWARSRAGRGAQEAAYVRDDRVREQDAVKHGSAYEDVPERLWAFTRNLVLASLILCAALLFAASAFYLTGAYFELDGRYTSSYAYWMLPELRLLDTIFGAACLPIALTVITAFASGAESAPGGACWFLPRYSSASYALPTTLRSRRLLTSAQSFSPLSETGSYPSFYM